MLRKRSRKGRGNEDDEKVKRWSCHPIMGKTMGSCLRSPEPMQRQMMILACVSN